MLAPLGSVLQCVMACAAISATELLGQGQTALQDSLWLLMHSPRTDRPAGEQGTPASCFATPARRLASAATFTPARLPSPDVPQRCDATPARPAAAPLEECAPAGPAPTGTRWGSGAGGGGEYTLGGPAGCSASAFRSGGTPAYAAALQPTTGDLHASAGGAVHAVPGVSAAAANGVDAERLARRCECCPRA